MSSLLKDIYSVSFYDTFSELVGEVIPSFDKTKFKQLIFNNDWEKKELKERMKHTALVLHDFLPEDFDLSAKIIEQIFAKLEQIDSNVTSNESVYLFEYMFFPEYIERFGLDHFETSVKTMEFVTQFTSCEFAVRPFIIKYGDRMIDQMLKWSLHKNEKVRRLSSEGCRPRLPWAMALPALKNDPAPILPILENLTNDPSEWVRRSVANNLNDISKDNPDIVIAIAKKWKGISPETDAILKHGCRTLLKQGHPVILKYYQLNTSDKIELSNFKIINPRLTTGDDLVFSFTLHNREITLQNIRIEYGLYYLKQNGQHSKKVFKISERTFQPDEKADIVRKQSFRIITTRKFYSGLHKLSIIINGQEHTAAEFELVIK
ncbi:MAG: DNA alkylation repair protein [Bacteroidales bacterium]|jgi:3-methyladenine DNA glycosylase AlkC|nr:DNA alkylation repair protein [Bacteroidales bacterium]